MLSRHPTLPYPNRPVRASDLIRDGKFSGVNVHDDIKTPQGIANEIGSSVIKEVFDIVAMHQPELLHIFTQRAGKNVPEESLAGTFPNRGGYYSALTKVNSGEYKEIIVPVADAKGLIAFEIEAVVTKGLNEHYSYIKSRDLEDFNSWECVTANFKLGVSTLNLLC